MGDVVFHNGAVFDGAGFLPAGTAVRVSGGRITQVGAAVGVAGADLVDLDGGSLVPGFIDAHAHPVFAGHQLRHCDLAEADTAAETLTTIAEYAATHPDDDWITGSGWSADHFAGGRPTRQILDSAVADRPVYLVNADGHTVWVNTVALQRAGIDAGTPDPADGRIDREDDRSPSGTFQEGAANLFAHLLPKVSAEDWYLGLHKAQDHLLSFGITGWQDAIVGDYMDGADPFPTYLRAAEDGTLRVNVVGALWWERSRGLDQLPELLERRRVGQVGRFRATSVKMMLDGVIETHTAAMLEPYLDHDGCCSPGHSGIDLIDPAELPRYVTALDREGFQIHFHVIGDRAVRNALDALQAAQRANPASSSAHHLAHLQVVHPDDIPRFAQLNATANIQALWATHHPAVDELTIPYLGDPRASWQYPFGSLHAAAARLCAGSDWAVSSPDPLAAIHVAVNRSAAVGPGQHPADPFLPDEALSLQTALAAYTSGSATINGLGSSVGTIAAGFDADFAIIDADLAHIPNTEIGNATVTQTWIRGQPAYQTR